MAHRTLVALALGLLSIAGGCTEDEGEPEPAPQGPQEVQFSSLATIDKTELQFCCDPNAPFPQTVGTIQLTTYVADPVEFTSPGQVQVEGPVQSTFLDADDNPTDDEESAVKVVETYEVIVDSCPPDLGWTIQIRVTEGGEDGDYAVENLLIENDCPPAEPPVELACGVPDQLWTTQGPIVNVTTADQVLVVGTDMGACDGTVAGGLADILSLSSTKYGAFLLRHVASSTEAALAYGPDGIALRAFDGGWGFTMVDPFVPGVDRNTTDAIPTADDSDSAEAIITRRGRNRVEILSYNDTTQYFTDVVILGASFFPGANGNAISACRPEIGGPVYVLFNSTTSQLYVKTDPLDNSTPATPVATLGSDGRRVRHEGDLLFISLSADNKLAVVNRTTLAVATYDVGNGPIGIDTQTLPNGDIAALTTGFNDHTFTITVVHADGTFVSSLTEPVPSGGQNPGSGVFLDDEKVAISANGSGKIYVFPYAPTPH
ncbi:MAG TPA: hypothetical protein VFY93_17970 [Planctomycetota bacterium]|nr:hypothetical protein [Planctomycetota bacterium]